MKECLTIHDGWAGSGGDNPLNQGNRVNIGARNDKESEVNYFCSPL